MQRFSSALWFIVVHCVAASGADQVDFRRDVQPILQAHCIECHGQEEQSSGLRLDRRSSTLRGGDLGQPSIVPGKPDASFLLTVVRGDHEVRMPPEGDLLSKKEAEVLQRWIIQGAIWPGQMDASKDDIESTLWSLAPIPFGERHGQTLSDTIDHLVQVKLHQSGLFMSPQADAVTLLRRVSLNLTGLPPTRNDLMDYLTDPGGAEVAYVNAVDRLLDSPRYGERWAQHWLDVIRWAETVGFETNLVRPNAWPYRDWVIQSFNEDKPYDEFLFEQIAGDTVGEDAALGFLVAGPANLPGQIGRDEEAMRQARQDELDEVIRTVSQATLGLTIGCARCHKHKFDPVSQTDYYAMQAIFAGLKYGDRRLRGAENDRWSEKAPEVREQLDQQRNYAKSLRQKLGLKPPLEALHTDPFEPVTARAVRMEITSTGSGSAASLYEFEVWTHGEPSHNVALASRGATPSASSFALANQTRHFENLIDGSSDRRQAFPWVSKDASPAWFQIDFAKPETIDHVIWDRGSSLPAEYVVKVLVTEENLDAPNDHWRVVADSTDRWLHEDDARSADTIHLRGLAKQDIAAVVQANAAVRATRAELRRLSSGPPVFAATFSDVLEPTWLLNRGDPMNRREVVVPAIPKVLGDLGLVQETSEQQRRIALARHLTNPVHPLTPRVMVNRVWQHHFGEGLVDTPSDFGKMGSQPTHKVLLDSLASEFVESGWSLKNLHRRIVLSRTFRQSSRPRDDALQLDAGSRLLWRYPPRRLEAEAIRDSILQTSGKLNLRMGGTGFNLFKQRGGLADYEALETFAPNGWRRMIYAHKIRMQSVDIFGSFDCPDAGQMKPKRTRSITPTQSLSLFNSPFVLRQADFFADRIRGEVPADTSEQVQRAFQIALCRLPHEGEHDHMLQLVNDEGLQQLCRVLMNSSEFLYIQ